MQLASLQNLTLKKMLHVDNIEQEKFFNRREADLVDSGHVENALSKTNTLFYMINHYIEINETKFFESCGKIIQK